MGKLFISWDKLIELAREGEDLTLLLEKLLLSYNIILLKEDKEIPILCFEDLYDVMEEVEL